MSTKRLTLFVWESIVRAWSIKVYFTLKDALKEETHRLIIQGKTEEMVSICFEGNSSLYNNGILFRTEKTALKGNKKEVFFNPLMSCAIVNLRSFLALTKFTQDCRMICFSLNYVRRQLHTQKLRKRPNLGRF